MAHKADGSFPVVIGGGGGNQGVGDGAEVLVGGQKRSTNGKRRKRVLIFCGFRYHFAVFHPIHHMCGLNDQVSDSIGCRPGQSLTGIVDGDSLPVFYAAYDRLVGKATAHCVFWKGFFHSGLNGPDG